MGGDDYSRGKRALKVAERLDVEIADPGAEAPIALACRWPEGDAPKAFVVFCHGLGSNGREYSELSRFWASHGYFVAHPTFPDSAHAVAAAEPELGVDPGDAAIASWTNIPALRARLYEILHTPHYWLERIRIVRRVMDALPAVIAECRSVPLPDLPPNLPPGAIAGHSFGAYTAQLFAGAEIDLPEQGARQFTDDRFRAAILLSAQGRDQQGLREGSWDGMRGPFLNVTGTRDGGAKGQDWRWKIEPYAFAPAGGKHLAVLEDADHYLGGLTLSDPGARVAAQREAVAQLTLAFLDAHVLGDASAAAWLASISDRVGDCRLSFERK